MSDDFKDDVIIVCDDGSICHISQDELKQRYKVLETNKYSLVTNLLRQGVQLAAVPTSPGANAAGDMMCYLVNLPGLNRPG
jgi:hypothetical protein